MNTSTKKNRNRKQARKKKPIGKDKTFFQCMAVALLATFVVYIPALSNEFLNWDDPLYVTQNPLVLEDWSMEKLEGIFSKAIAGNYHPITILSLAIDHTLFGESAFGFHWMNIFFHLVSVALMFWFMYLFTKRNLVISFLVALLFGIHPMHVESVAWISERKDVLYVLFFLGGLIAYLKYVFSKHRKPHYYLIAFGLFLLSAFSKPAAVVFPVVLVLIDFYLFKRWRPKMLQNKIIFFVGAIAVGLITIQTQANADAIKEISTFYNRILFASYGFNTYLGKLFVPVGLSALYPYPLEMHLNQTLPFIFQISPLITLGIAGFAFYLMKRFAPPKVVIWSFAFYLVTIALVLQLVSVGYALMAERYTYLPYTGIFFLLAWLFHRYAWKSQNRTIFVGALTLYLLVLGSVTWQRCEDWRDTGVLFTDVLEKFSEANPVARFTRGNHHFANKDYDKAIVDYTETVRISPMHHRAFTNRGDIYKERGEFQKALEDYNSALKVNPTFLDAILHRADLYLKTGQADMVLQDSKTALSIHPNSAVAYNMMAGAYFQQNQYDLGMQNVNKALEIKPKFEDAYLNRAIIYSVQNNHAMALKDYNAYLKLKTNDVKAYMWRGIAHRNLQNWQAAKADFDRVIAEQPNNKEAYRNRAMVFAALGQEAKAAQDNAKAGGMAQ